MAMDYLDPLATEPPTTDLAVDEIELGMLDPWIRPDREGIFAKLRDVTRPGDRVVVVFGAGHKHWLEQIARNTPGFAVVEVSSYLSSDSATP